MTTERQREVWNRANERRRQRQRGEIPPYVPLSQEIFGGGEWVPCKNNPELGECLEWRGATLPKGYGRVRQGNRTRIVSQVALEKKLGRPLLPNHYALHRCDNPPCFNPNHLFEGTLEENYDDMTTKGRAYWQRSDYADSVRSTREVQS